MSTTTTQSQFQREILLSENNEKVTAILQQNLVNFVDLALLMKQAHWNVVGTNFRSVHLQLDEIIASTREGSDELAERIATLGVSADGRSATVDSDSELKAYPEGFQDAPTTVKHVADAIKTAVDTLRASVEKLGDLDPVSEDLCIGIAAPMEKHLWMLQAQEV